MENNKECRFMNLTSNVFDFYMKSVICDIKGMSG